MSSLIERAWAKLNRCEMVRTKGESCAKDLAKEMGLDPHLSVIRGPLKEVERLCDKAAGRCNGNVEEVNDGARVRVLFGSPDQFFALRSVLGPGRNSSAIIKDWKSRGIEILEFEDNFLEPKEHGYIGATLVLEVPMTKGRKERFEIQFMHENMQITDKISREFYEGIRDIEDGAIEHYNQQEKRMGRELTKHRNEKERKAFAWKIMTPNEKAAVINYILGNIHLYKADAKNYGLDRLLNDPNSFDVLAQKLKGQEEKNNTATPQLVTDTSSQPKAVLV